MKKHYIFLIALVSALVSGCQNLDSITTTQTTSYTQERVANSVDPAYELFSTGSEAIGETGQDFAQMKALEEANADLRDQVLKETETLLSSHMTEVQFFDSKRKKKVINELSEFITNQILKEAKEKDVWIEDDQVHNILVVEKNAVPLKTRDTFILFVDNLISKLESTRSNLLGIPIDDNYDSFAGNNDNINITKDSTLLDVFTETSNSAPAQNNSLPFNLNQDFNKSSTQKIDVQL